MADIIRPNFGGGERQDEVMRLVRSIAEMLKAAPSSSTDTVVVDREHYERMVAACNAIAQLVEPDEAS